MVTFWWCRFCFLFLRSHDARSDFALQQLYCILYINCILQCLFWLFKWAFYGYFHWKNCINTAVAMIEITIFFTFCCKILCTNLRHLNLCFVKMGMSQLTSFSPISHQFSNKYNSASASWKLCDYSKCCHFPWSIWGFLGKQSPRLGFCCTSATESGFSWTIYFK